MKLKDFKPKYDMLEFLPSKTLYCSDTLYTVRHCKLISYKKVIKKYGDCEVLSFKDYDDTRTTSVIVYVGKLS